jgi:hypothetical protein
MSIDATVPSSQMGAGLNEFAQPSAGDIAFNVANQTAAAQVIALITGYQVFGGPTAAGYTTASQQAKLYAVRILVQPADLVSFGADYSYFAGSVNWIAVLAQLQTMIASDNF